MTIHPIKLRKASPRDLDGILEIEQDSFATPGERFSRRQVAGLIRNPRGETIVAVDAGGRIVGWAAGLVRRSGGRRGGEGEMGRDGEKRGGEGERGRDGETATASSFSVSASPPLRVPASSSSLRVSPSPPLRVSSSGRIYAIAVHSHARGLGIGRRIMERLMKFFARRGCGRVFLEVRADNSAAIALYRQFGFTQRHIIADYYARGLHAVSMVAQTGSRRQGWGIVVRP